MSSPIPDNFPALIERAALEFGDLEAVSDGGTVLNYTELCEQIERCAAALVASGIEPGDRVAVWAPNTWEWVVAGFAAFRAGAVMVPVNTRFKGREAAFVLEKARVKLLFTVVGFLGYDYVAELADQSIPSLTEIIVLRGETPKDTTDLASFLNRGTATDHEEVRRRSAAAQGDDLGLIMFTSGTTGLPKGVLVTQSPLIRGFDYYAQELGVRAKDRVLVISPFFHAFGFGGAIAPCFMNGATILPHPVYDPEPVLKRIQDDAVTIFTGPPALFQGLFDHEARTRYDISSLRGSVLGASNIAIETVIAMREKLGFETVLTGFGMTETHGLATLCKAGDPPELVASTSGKAIPGVELRVVDDDGQVLSPGEQGELQIKGYVVMPGYLDDPEQTAEAIDPEGWLRTGDICVMNAQGYIDITDRKKDMFINGGFNVYPAEIERVMLEHPGVSQVAVIGVPDSRLGEVGAAFVVRTPTDASDPETLLAWCREQMANYKAPRFVWTVDALPMNAANKVLKTELRERAKGLMT